MCVPEDRERCSKVRGTIKLSRVIHGYADFREPKCFDCCEKALCVDVPRETCRRFRSFDRLLQFPNERVLVDVLSNPFEHARTPSDQPCSCLRSGTRQTFQVPEGGAQWSEFRNTRGVG